MPSSARHPFAIFLLLVLLAGLSGCNDSSSSASAPPPASGDNDGGTDEDGGANEPGEEPSAGNETLLDAAIVCDADAGDPAPDTPEWFARDMNNVACSAQRQEDILTSPAFFRLWLVENAGAAGDYYPDILADLLTEPERLRINPIYFNPSAKVGDPFRNPETWEANGRGQMTRITFLSRGGAHLRARIYSPNPMPDEGLLPAIVFMPGLQSYNEVNSWFGQGMAEEGYIVLVVDPQGQGDSENFNHDPDGTPTDTTTSNIPSSLDFLLSTPNAQHPHAGSPNAEGALTFNPLWARVDPERIGIAGHSMGAIESRNLAHTDPRVKVAVNYDDLGGAPSVNVTTPVLYFYTDYAFPTFSIPKRSPPDPNEHMEAFTRLSEAGLDVMAITTRASTHYEWGYQPFPASFPASRYGERISFYYSLAWFDRFLQDDDTALARLTARLFDGSADRSSIGAGTYDPERELQDPLNPYSGNVPYKIRGKCVAHLLSFYYRSAFYLDGGARQSADMRALGCETDL